MRYLENYIFEKYDGKMWFGDIRITLKPDNWYHTKIFVNRWFQLVHLNEILELNHSEKTLYTINFKFKVIR